jgi:hypothetical protein
MSPVEPTPTSTSSTTKPKDSATNPTPSTSSTFSHTPAQWVWDAFYSQPGYPPPRKSP